MVVRGMARLGMMAVLAAALIACSDDGSGPGGETVTVEMRDNSFSPTPRSVSAGTTVRWVNQGTVQHNTTSETDLWASQNLQPGASFSRRFDSAGTFPYECTLHPGMTGTIVVN